MRKKRFHLFLLLFLLLLFLLPHSPIEARRKIDLVGREVPYFTLPSSQDRAITYADEYYGKYHLVITFFPAAFTPL